DDFPLETELRKLLTGHEGGNAEHSQGVSDELVAPALDQLYRVFNQAIRGLIDSSPVCRGPSPSDTLIDSLTMAASLTPVLTPHGHLLLAQADDTPELLEALSERLQRAFARGHGHGLLQLGAGEVKTELPSPFVYWR